MKLHVISLKLTGVLRKKYFAKYGTKFAQLWSIFPGMIKSSKFLMNFQVILANFGIYLLELYGIMRLYKIE
jgi:hypothetical protein